MLHVIGTRISSIKYASVMYTVVVCLSVRVCVPKRLNVGSCIQRHSYDSIAHGL